MRILVLDTHYQEALNQVYTATPEFESQSSDKQLKLIYNSGFGRADSLTVNLRNAGCEAAQFVVNALPVQLRWARENGLSDVGPMPESKLRHLWRRAEWRFGLRTNTPGINVAEWEMEIVRAQVRSFGPEVIFICDVLYYPARFHLELKQMARLLVGEMAYPIPPGLEIKPFDLIVSAAPHYVTRIREAGVNSELLRLGFEESILEHLDPTSRDTEVAFVGSVGKSHTQRLELLEELSRRVPLSIWGTGADSLRADSPLRAKMHGSLWGYDMYRQLQRSKIALNIHIDMAEKFAANMRLYEATGVGTMLVTDWKQNLGDLFEDRKEVVAYRSIDECADLITYYLEHDEEREAIARAGQRRTLGDHTYRQRMHELVEILDSYLRLSSESDRRVSGNSA
ncbi:MAG: hypothetical protein C5B55_04945 [Blastocatellia bacterium]|nr:MAG: hypothetical protein C5B55_04945 [Blastocatellia bacterium]